MMLTIDAYRRVSQSRASMVAYVAFCGDRYFFSSLQYSQWLFVCFWCIRASRRGQSSTARDDGLVKGDKELPTQQDMRAAAFVSERMRGRQLP